MTRVVNNTFYHLLVLAWGLRYFWKRESIRKGCVEIEDWGTSVYFVWRFQENYMQSLSANKGILKALFSFIPWLLNFSDLLWLKIEEKICTKAIVKVSREEHPHSAHWGITSPPITNTTPSFLPTPPHPLLKSANCLSPPFLGNPFLFIGFSWTLPKSRIFQWIPKILKFFILNIIFSFKSN